MTNEKNQEYQKLFHSLTSEEIKLLYVFYGDNLDKPFSFSALAFFADGIDLVPTLQGLLSLEILKEIMLTEEHDIGEIGYQVLDRDFYEWVQANVVTGSTW